MSTTLRLSTPEYRLENQFPEKWEGDGEPYKAGTKLDPSIALFHCCNGQVERHLAEWQSFHRESF